MTGLPSRSLLAWPPLAWTDEAEWMDAPGHDPAVLLDNLGDLRRVNRWVGGVWLTVRGLDRLTADLPAGAALSILDLATGGADIPRALVAWAQRRRLRARILATDVSPEILALARAWGPGAERGVGGRGSEIGARRGLPGPWPLPPGPRPPTPGPLFAVADARCLPFGDRSVDVVHCSLALHHQLPDDGVAMLAEMGRVARLGVVVNDIVRCWKGYWGARLVTRVCSRNVLTRHDGPLSVRRAFTRPEMAAMAARAGLGPVAFDGFLGYRVAMTARVGG